ncbi:hypothetical protein ES708_11369 [subsurface metagenome]
MLLTTLFLLLFYMVVYFYLIVFQCLLLDKAMDIENWSAKKIVYVLVPVMVLIVEAVIYIDIRAIL